MFLLYLCSVSPPFWHIQTDISNATSQFKSRIPSPVFKNTEIVNFVIDNPIIGLFSSLSKQGRRIISVCLHVEHNSRFVKLTSRAYVRRNVTKGMQQVCKINLTLLSSAVILIQRIYYT